MHYESMRIASTVPRTVWNDIFRYDPEAVPYQSAEWLDGICTAAPYEDASRLYEFDDGQKLVLPLVRRRGFPAVLSTAASQPNAWGMGGLIAAQPVQSQQITFVLADLAKLPYARISIRPNPRLGDLWAVAASHIRNRLAAIPRLAHVLDLDGGFNEVWMKRFSGQTRKNVRKAEKSGIVVECDTTGRLMPVFYDLLRLSFDRWAAKQREPALLARLRGHQRDSLEKFRIIARTLKDACHVWVAWINGQPAAAIVVLQYHNVNDARGAMDKELVAQTGANDLIQKLAIEAACQAGCRYYHMGESGASTGLAHFKERFGAVAHPYAEYYLERFPFTRLDRGWRTLVKKLIGFKDV